MKIILSDLINKNNIKINDEYKIINADKASNCIGCFSCWVKTPLKCINHDEIQNIGKDILNSDELIIISKCINGNYSSKIKRILERSISYVKPYFTLRENEIHHKVRSNKKIKFSVYFYENINELNKNVSKELIYRNSLNLNTKEPNIYYFKDCKEIKEL